MASGLIYDDEGNDITMSIADDIAQEETPHRGVAHYKGDVRNSDYIAAARDDGSVMKAVMVEYDEAANITTVHFEQTFDPQWVMALAQEQWAQQNLPGMYPAFFPRK